jgi:transcriptional regulator with XRE-family HTH domain
LKAECAEFEGVAAMVTRWTGVETRNLRHALRLTVRGFAEHLGVSVRTVSKWEAGASAIEPRPELQAVLDTALRRASAEARARFHDLARTGSNSRGEPERLASVSILAERQARAWPAPDPQHQAAALAIPHRFLDRISVESLRRRLLLLKADDGRLDVATTLPLVLEVIELIHQQAVDVKPVVRQHLLAVGADAAEFLGWLYRDLHDAPRALYWHDRAIEWAQEVGDLPLQGYVLLKKAQLAYDERDALRMFTLTQAVRTGPWALPLRVRAEATQQQARAEAMLGATIQEVRGRLDEARDLLLAAAEMSDDSQLGAHYTGTLLTMQTAVCYSEAGQPQQAVDLFRSSLTEQAFSPRDFGYFMSWRATAEALAGEPDRAAETALLSIRRASSAGSGRTRREVVRVLHRLSPWRHRPAVRELAAAVGA